MTVSFTFGLCDAKITEVIFLMDKNDTSEYCFIKSEFVF